MAEDEDREQGHKFRLLADVSGLFSTDGESLMASEAFDYEQDPARQFVITVEVTDDGTPPMKASDGPQSKARLTRCLPLSPFFIFYNK